MSSEAIDLYIKDMFRTHRSGGAMTNLSTKLIEKIDRHNVYSAELPAGTTSAWPTVTTLTFRIDGETPIKMDDIDFVFQVEGITEGTSVTNAATMLAASSLNPMLCSMFSSCILKYNNQEIINSSEPELSQFFTTILEKDATKLADQKGVLPLQALPVSSALTSTALEKVFTLLEHRIPLSDIFPMFKKMGVVRFPGFFTVQLTANVGTSSFRFCTKEIAGNDYVWTAVAGGTYLRLPYCTLSPEATAEMDSMMMKNNAKLHWDFNQWDWHTHTIANGTTTTRFQPIGIDNNALLFAMALKTAYTETLDSQACTHARGIDLRLLRISRFEIVFNGKTYQNHTDFSYDSSAPYYDKSTEPYEMLRDAMNPMIDEPVLSRWRYAYQHNVLVINLKTFLAGELRLILDADPVQARNMEIRLTHSDPGAGQTLYYGILSSRYVDIDAKTGVMSKL